MQATVGEQLRITSGEAERIHPSLVTNDRLGVEEELEGINGADLETARAYLAPLWTSHQDGSLRNGGVEFVTNGGLGGQSLFSAFERITHLLANVIEYQDTFRCSTHMHVNMLDFTVPQVAKFLMVYAACEPYLFAHCGQYRRSSNFCVPVGDSLPFHKNLIANLYEDCVATRSGSRVTNKYTAMNLQPLFGSDRVRPIGTVEFRGGRPMTTMEDFLLQANLLLSIKEFVRRGPEDAEELLHLMGDTVTNSVYANGVAAGLNVQQADLEQATIDAWMLLKSYQQGMKKPRGKKFSGWGEGEGDVGLPVQGFEWGTTHAEPLNVEPLPDLPADLNFWNSAVFGLPGSRFVGNRGGVIPTNMSNPYPNHWRNFSRLFTEIGNTPTGRRFRDVLVSMLCDTHLGRYALSVEEAYTVAISWQLRNLEDSPLHSIRRAMVDRIERGKHQCILENVTFDHQPGIKMEEMTLSGFNWADCLPSEMLHTLGTLWDCNFTYIIAESDSEDEIEATNCWSMFQQMLCTVRVKNMETLKTALEQVIDGRGMPILRRDMYATEMYHLLRIAGLPSANHIHREDLAKFDKVATTMTVLYAFGASVPVMCYPRRNALGTAGLKYHIRLSRNPFSTIGLSLNELRHEHRTARTTVIVGDSQINVY